MAHEDWVGRDVRYWSGSVTSERLDFLDGRIVEVWSGGEGGLLSIGRFERPTIVTELDKLPLELTVNRFGVERNLRLDSVAIDEQGFIFTGAYQWSRDLYVFTDTGLFVPQGTGVPQNPDDIERARWGVKAEFGPSWGKNILRCLRLNNNRTYIFNWKASRLYLYTGTDGQYERADLIDAPVNTIIRGSGRNPPGTALVGYTVSPSRLYAIERHPNTRRLHMLNWEPGSEAHNTSLGEFTTTEFSEWPSPPSIIYYDDIEDAVFVAFTRGGIWKYNADLSEVLAVHEDNWSLSSTANYNLCKNLRVGPDSIVIETNFTVEFRGRFIELRASNLEVLMDQEVTNEFISGPGSDIDNLGMMGAWTWQAVDRSGTRGLFNFGLVAHPATVVYLGELHVPIDQPGRLWHQAQLLRSR